MKTYGIIGWPLGHSFSARYFGEKFALLGLDDHRYLNFPIENIGMLPGILAANPDLRGFNVTMPHKKTVMSLLDEISPEAEEIGAVNCVRVDGKKLTGYNTDGYGFRTSLEELVGEERPKALVLGTGGASSAVRRELARMGIDHTMVSRARNGYAIAYDDITPAIMASHRLIVNTTPLGTWPDTDSKPDIPYEQVGPRHFLYDLVYNPPMTAFLSEGALRGAAVMNGEKMLVRQAEKSWTIWNKGKLSISL